MSYMQSRILILNVELIDKKNGNWIETALAHWILSWRIDGILTLNADLVDKRNSRTKFKTIFRTNIAGASSWKELTNSCSIVIRSTICSPNSAVKSCNFLYPPPYEKSSWFEIQGFRKIENTKRATVSLRSQCRYPVQPC